MHTGAAQADVTPSAVNVIIMSRTKQHTINVKDKYNKSFKHSIEFNERSLVTYSSPMLGCVVLYIY